MMAIRYMAYLTLVKFDKTAWINERDGLYCDLLTGTLMEAAGVNIPAYGYMWLKKVR